MEASQTNVEYPSPKPTDYENWFEYRYGVSKNPDYDDDDWQSEYFVHYSQGQIQKLPKIFEV